MGDDLALAQQTQSRPWPVPTSYVEYRLPSRHAVYVHLPDGGPTPADLHYWLRHAELGWYGYVTWWRGRTLYTEPVPADRLEPYPFRTGANAE